MTLIGLRFLRPRAFSLLVALAIGPGLMSSPAWAQFEWLFGHPSPPPMPSTEGAPASGAPSNPKKSKAAKAKKPHKPAEVKPAAPAAEVEVPAPYDPELLRLAEILGALTYLDRLCGQQNPSGEWRGRMQALMEAEARTKARKERLAGSYNRGFRDYERTYHLCTPNAEVVISRFLVEGGKLAQALVSRYGAS
ncbi:MAG: TIGR02301 family protein [Alphaproteobacteria bacterium]|nr:TIGR02301 family protein [Alphaproteobacteria bacterium]